MIGFYTPLLILQAFCIYHAYRHNAEHRWYWLIVFFPGLGCAIYLYHNFYNRNNIQTISEGVKGVMNASYKLEQLEKAVKFSDSIANKTNLADAYVNYEMYPEAILQYRECLTGYMADDSTLRMKLLNALYLNHDYNATVEIGNMLESEKEFKNSEQRIAYAWALHRVGKTDMAEKIFCDMNRSFTNYMHRVEYCNFLLGLDKLNEAKLILAELADELEHMKGPERKLYRNVIFKIKEMHRKYVEVN